MTGAGHGTRKSSVGFLMLTIHVILAPDIVMPVCIGIRFAFEYLQTFHASFQASCSDKGIFISILTTPYLSFKLCMFLLH